MTDFTAGDIATLDYTLCVDGVLTDATVTVTVTDPDGNETQPGVNHTSTGVYSTDVPVDADGTWQYEWTASGAATDTATGSFTVGPSLASEDLNVVRLLISDVSTPRTFTDGELLQFLTLEGDSVKLAAAQALDAIASNEALVKQRIRTLDLQTDGPAVAKSLREHATALRAQVTDEVGGDFEVTTGLGTPELAERASCWPH